MSIYQYVSDNPESHNFSFNININSINEKLEFYYGVNLPSKLLNFLLIVDGVGLDGFYIHSANEILGYTLNNDRINLQDQEKRIEIGKLDDGYLTYNYSTELFESLDVNGDIFREFDTVFSIFDYFYNLIYQGQAIREEKSYEDLILDGLNSI